jgi:hypothetical protein
VNEAGLVERAVAEPLTADENLPSGSGSFARVFASG